MAYNNLIYRLFTSVIIILILSIFLFIFSNYLYLFIGVIYLLIFFEIFIFFKKKNFIYFLSLVYILLSFISIEVYLSNYFNKQIFIYLIFIIIIFDTTSYIFGSKFGNKLLLPKISPNKTFVGLYSGILFTIFF